MTINTNDLLRLAERAEKADGPDRELDAIIWLHLSAQSKHDWKHDGDKFAHARQITGCAFIPAYTASIDAAMTLVPDWVHIGRIGWCSNVAGFAELCRKDERRGDTISARTLPLALVAVSLRALATRKEQSNG